MNHVSAMTSLHALVQSLPIGLEPKRSVTPGERPFSIHQGNFTLQQGRRRVRLRGSATLYWSPGPELRFDTSPTSSWTLQSSGPQRMGFEAGQWS